LPRGAFRSVGGVREDLAVVEQQFGITPRASDASVKALVTENIDDARIFAVAPSGLGDGRPLS
jgi:hypothetical protein